MFCIFLDISIYFGGTCVKGQQICHFLHFSTKNAAVLFRGISTQADIDDPPSGQTVFSSDQSSCPT